MENKRDGVMSPMFRVVSSDATDVETPKKFDPEVLEAFGRIGFKLGDNGNIVRLPRFVLYKSGGEVQARVLEVLTDESGMIDGVPALELQIASDGGRKEQTFRLPVTSEWLEKFGN